MQEGQVRTAQYRQDRTAGVRQSIEDSRDKRARTGKSENDNLGRTMGTGELVIKALVQERRDRTTVRDSRDRKTVADSHDRICVDDNDGQIMKGQDSLAGQPRPNNCGSLDRTAGTGMQGQDSQDGL